MTFYFKMSLILQLLLVISLSTLLISGTKAKVIYPRFTIIYPCQYL